MDTSKRYVDMCTIALELQDAWVPLPWDYIFCRVDHTITCIMPTKPAAPLAHHWFDGKLIQGCECCGSKKEHIWLPRQDQIQDRLMVQSSRLTMFLTNFSRFAKHKPGASLEEISLRYFMHLRANKVWWRDNWLHKATVAKYGYKRQIP